MVQKKFRYNLDLETALRMLCGDKYRRFADDAAYPEKVREALFNWTKEAKIRLKESTKYNKDLQVVVESIELLEEEIKKIGLEENEWKIIAGLLSISGFLIRYFEN